ncbi:phage tail protein [Micromonospora rubida]|uniref:Phage tail protein n=1 Tax=Micromonospora rubida TaxID=2697657 RepID=A0ABW7SLI1_9ACTN
MTDERPAYDLLPVVHRIRDAEQNHPLRALLEVVENELRRLTDDIDQRYEDWFIETCAEWVVPYLGDLVGVSGLHPLPDGVASQRAFVANTIRYRRRKGTAAVLEQVVRDVTGWPTRAVEYFRLLGSTQHLDHVRPASGGTVDLRDADALDLLTTPFTTQARTGEVRHVDVGRGRFNIANIGLHLWRLSAYPVTGADARAVDAAVGRWTFDPAGRDRPLFHVPVTETDVTRSAEEVNVPGPIRRRALRAELTGATVRVLAPLIRLDEDAPLTRLACCDLTDWHRPPGDAQVAVDPVLGRLTLPAGVTPNRVRVDYAYGFPGDLGGGPYDRHRTVASSLALAGTPWPAQVPFQVGVSREIEPVSGQIVATLGAAVQLWNARRDTAPGAVGVIAVLDSATYTEDLSVQIPPGNRLLIVAAGWPAHEAPDDTGLPVREPGVFVPAGQRPHLVGSIMVTGLAEDSATGTELILDGLSVEGGLTVAPGDLTSLVVADTTLLAGPSDTAGWVGSSGNAHLTIRLLRAVCAGVRATDLPGLTMTDSIAYADGPEPTVDVPAADVELAECTFLGRTVVRGLVATNTILRGRLDVADRQFGYVRFSYLPTGSRAPRRYRCLPTGTEPLAPAFTSVDPVDPAFCQLAGNGPAEFGTAADDGGEIGAYHFLGQAQRMANLRSQLDHYLRFGLEAGTFFTS